MFTFVIVPPGPLKGIRVSPQKGGSRLTGLASIDKPDQTNNAPPRKYSHCQGSWKVSSEGSMVGEGGGMEGRAMVWGLSLPAGAMENPSRMLCKSKRLH